MDSVLISYTIPLMNILIKVEEKAGFSASAKQVSITTTTNQELYIRMFELNLSFLNQDYYQILRGPKAINSGNSADNIQLGPYSDKAIEYKFSNSSLWMVASNYEGCENVQWLRDDGISLFDYKLHFARRYDPATDQFPIMNDTFKRPSGQMDHWSFLIFAEKPVLLSLNRWYNRNKAAFVITNDADGETERKMKAIYFGSSDTSSPKYMTEDYCQKT